MHSDSFSTLSNIYKYGFAFVRATGSPTCAARNYIARLHHIATYVYQTQM